MILNFFCKLIVATNSISIKLEFKTKISKLTNGYQSLRISEYFYKSFIGIFIITIKHLLNILSEILLIIRFKKSFGLDRFLFLGSSSWSSRSLRSSSVISRVESVVKNTCRIVTF